MKSNSGKPDGEGLVPRIGPVPAEVGHPLWSVMIPTYNCAKYLRETLESVLAQDPGHEQMQIEVVDDCSDRDDPEQVVKEIGRGRVLFYRKPANEGAVCNFNTCIERSRGYLVHILHGDDLVEAGFYREFGAAFDATPECEAIFCRAFLIDENRDLLGLSEFYRNLNAGSNDLRDLIMDNRITSPAAVVKRRFYERYGGFDTSLIHAADWDMWVRAVVKGGARMLNRPLASYRMFDASDTGRLRRSAEHLRDTLRFYKKCDAADLAQFDRDVSHNNLIRWSFAEARNFQRLGDQEAARMNYKFFCENSTIQQRGRICVALFLRKLSRYIYSMI
jgi:glycosyltransferase involved in cell wall biosynthesis